MDFLQKYVLVELLPGEGVRSYRARQTNTGRDVTVHLLVGGKTPENEALLVRLRGMQPQSMAKLIEVGEHQGDTFVVTVAPPYQRLDEWLAEQDRAASAAREFGKAGFWKRPDAGSLTPPPSAVAPPPAPAAELDELAKMFGAPPASSATGQFTPPPPVATPPSGPGEFTQMFQSPVAPSPPTSTPQSEPRPLGSGSSSEPGQFTQMFQSPAAPPAPPAAAGPGEFTRMFQSPMPDVPAQGDWPPAPAKPQEPGEFTRMFQAPPSPPAGPHRPEAGNPPP